MSRRRKPYIYCGDGVKDVISPAVRIGERPRDAAAVEPPEEGEAPGETPGEALGGGEGPRKAPGEGPTLR